MVKLSTSNPRYEDVPLNIPLFRWSSDLSYWDATMGAVSDSSRKMMWLWLATWDIVVTAIIGFVLTSILVKPEARRKPYNIFLVFLMIPDLIFSALEPPIYFLNYVVGKYISVEVCKFQGFILPLGLFANCHINAQIAWELHRMLRDSYGRKRYFPPSAWQVSKRCLTSYSIVATVTLLWAFNFENLPFRVFLTGGGTFCVPAPYDTNSALGFYLGLLLIGLHIPFGICGFVTMDVLRRGLLPGKGEGKRILTMFFFRLLLVFLAFWTPTMLSVFVSSNPWFSLFGAVWSHSQGAVSAIAMLSKADILDCAKDLWERITCSNLSSNGMDNRQERTTPQRTLAIDDFVEDLEDTEACEDTTSRVISTLQDEANDLPEDTLPTVFENEPSQ